jgi:hypothetical protein
MSDNDPAAPATGEKSNDKPKKNVYDYRTSTIDEDRAAALEVEKRVEQQRREENGAADKTENAVMTQEEREDGAARLLQGQYS